MWKILIKPKNVAGTIFAVVFIWMISGVLKEKKHEDVPITDQPPKYRSLASEAAAKAPSLRLTGTTTAKKNVSIFAQADGMVVKIFAKSGQRMSVGEPILEMESKNKKEAMRAAADNFKSAELNYKSVMTLYNSGLSSRFDLDNAAVTLENAKSDLALSSTELAHIIVRAPFDGYVDYISAHEGDVVQFGTATAALDGSLASYVSLEDMTVHVQLSEQERAAVARQLEIAQNIAPQNASYTKQSNNGDQVKAEKTLTNVKVPTRQQGALRPKVKIANILHDDKKYDGFLRFISRSIDINCNTFLLELDVHNETNLLVNGQTVDVILYGHKVPAHAIPQSALILNDRGDSLSVKTIQNKIVKSYDVSVLSEDESSVWVTGLPEKVEIITMGQAYIEDGTAL